MRDVADAALHVVRTGRRWRRLPKDFPPKGAAWEYLGRRRSDGTPARIPDAPPEKARQKGGKKPTPGAAGIDSRSAQAAEGGEERGADARKKVKGRKRRLVADAPGLPPAAALTGAGVGDGRAAPDAPGRLPKGWPPRPRLVWADQKRHNHEPYGRLAEYAHDGPESVRRPEGGRGFVPPPRRRAAERAFAWPGRCRRLAVDRERATASSEARTHRAMIHRMLNRLRPSGEEKEFRCREAA